MRSRRANSRRPSTAATTGTRRYTATGCWCGSPSCIPSRTSHRRPARRWHRPSRRRTSPPRSSTCEARVARPSSGPTGSPGCSSSRRNSTAWNDPQAREWRAALVPLEQESARRFTDWLPKLHYPIRVGEHDQTAFAFGLLVRLGRGRRRYGDRGPAPRASPGVLRAGPQLPARLRAVGRGLPLALPRRGGLHAAHAAAAPSIHDGSRPSCPASRPTAAPTGSSPVS